jgi:hypothetical protein
MQLPVTMANLASHKTFLSSSLKSFVRPNFGSALLRTTQSGCQRKWFHHPHSFHELREQLGLTSMTSKQEMDGATKHSIINSTFPVLLPEDPALFMPEAEFQAFIRNIVTESRNPNLDTLQDEIEIIDSIKDMSTDGTVSSSRLKRRATSEAEDDRKQKSAFMDGLRQHAAHSWTTEELEEDNKKLTENADVTNISTKNPLVDLFYDLSENIAGDKPRSLLENAWKEDSLMTLKIIFNARSIHLGKSDKMASYKAFGWLAESHPLTLLTNLKWLVRPVIQKKVPKLEAKGIENVEGRGEANDDDENFDMVDVEEKDTATSGPDKKHDVRYGVSHGYYKDVLNLLAFAANDILSPESDYKALLNQHPDKSTSGKRKREWDPAKAKELRKQRKKQQHERVQQKLNEDGFYRALHLTVARLFAAQLKEDAANLKSGKKSDMKKLSLAAKWAPSASEFHDQHTFVLSSIAEILFPTPAEICPDASNRELYLRYAREAYRKTIASPLRKALSVVERDIAAESKTPGRFAGNIQYERVPSLAMDRYTPLFLKKDYENFASYIENVTEGKAQMSGATLLPSTMIKKALEIASTNVNLTAYKKTFATVKVNAEAKITRQVIDGQWKTLVQRIRDSGTLNSSIAVCDVSGSMSSPKFADGTTPMDSAIGLSLLLAEISAPPWGGSFITFSEQPRVISIGGEQDTRGLVEKANLVLKSNWGMNTNLVAVFEDLILGMAVKQNLPQEDMVKQVFVFSDMQFDAADAVDDRSNRWTTSFERIKAKFAAEGYLVPKLIFWNLAGHRTDKPVTMDDTDTALVSGYSQGMLKVFLDGGGFEDTEDEMELEEEVEIEESEDEDGVKFVRVKRRKKMDPMTTVRKAVSHAAYGMLEVVD